MSYAGTIFKRIKKIDVFTFLPITLNLTKDLQVLSFFYLLLHFIIFCYHLCHPLIEYFLQMLKSSFKRAFWISNLFFKHSVSPRTRFHQFKTTDFFIFVAIIIKRHELMKTISQPFITELCNFQFERFLPNNIIGLYVFGAHIPFPILSNFLYLLLRDSVSNLLSCFTSSAKIL